VRGGPVLVARNASRSACAGLIRWVLPEALSPLLLFNHAAGCVDLFGDVSCPLRVSKAPDCLLLLGNLKSASFLGLTFGNGSSLCLQRPRQFGQMRLPLPFLFCLKGGLLSGLLCFPGLPYRRRDKFDNATPEPRKKWLWLLGLRWFGEPGFDFLGCCSFAFGLLGRNGILEVIATGVI
jgi:hypothetical protein